MKFYKPTVSQRLIWLDQLIAKTSSKYNIGGYAFLEGDLNLDVFNSAIKKVLLSQEVYASRFMEAEGDLMACLGEDLRNYTIPVIDLSSAEDPEARAMSWMKNDFSVAFDIENDYLFNFTLLKISGSKFFWYAKMHHIISDGWSFKLLLNQAAAFYDSFVTGKEHLFTDFRYSDYALEDDIYYHSPEAENDRAFWLSEYPQVPPELFKRKRGALGPLTAPAGSHTLYLTAEVKQGLQRSADAAKVSLFQLITGLLLIYFYRTRQQEEICIAVPVLNRTKKIYRSVAGVFMNLLPLKFRLADCTDLSDVLGHVRQKMSAALRHQRYQYGNLVKELKLPLGKLLYDIRISYEDFDFAADFGGLRTGAIALSNHEETDKLALYLRDYNGQGFDIRFVYNTGYFDETSIRSVSDSFERIVFSLFQEEQLPLSRIPLLHEEELQRIISLGTGPVKERKEQMFSGIWEATCSNYALNICVSTGKESFTYKDIDGKAKAIAASLIRHHKEEGHAIALLLPRTEKMLTGILGCMMAGLTYIPLDPGYPEQRISDILLDAGCRMLLTGGGITATPAGLDHITTLRIEDLEASGGAWEGPNNNMGNERPCYIIYTSGSTGRPKGVMIAHSALVDYVHTFREYFQLSQEDVVLQQASISFDTSVEEIFPILAAGGRLHILEDSRDFDSLLHTLQEERISILSTNPFVINLLNDYTLPASLRVLISGGDVLKPSYVKHLLQQRVAVYNTYGPTESTVCATYYQVKEQDEAIPIGAAITNREIYILDNYLNLQPPGVEGEICLGGKGLAIGYVNNKTATEEKFLDGFPVNGKRIYRTGDMGIMLADGNVMFTGRKDDQLSYRGYRIESYEIEKMICGEPGVADCLADVQYFGGVPFLMAYITYAAGPAHSPAEWRQLLKHRLPSYMIPEVWVELDKMPLLLNGKVDRKALPTIHADMFRSGSTDKELPAPGLETAIAQIWKDILNQQLIGRDDSFFETGGHSLNVMQLVNHYHKAFEVKISVQELFEHTTISSHARLIEGRSATSYTAIGKVPEARDYAVSDGQRRLWVICQMEESSRAYHLSGHLRLEGNYQPAFFEAAVKDLIARHEILRTVFRENEEGAPRQVVLPLSGFSFEFSFRDFQDAPSALVQEYLEQQASGAFDLEQGPLLRAGLIQVAATDYLFHYTLHHIISDGWSMEILGKEVLENYDTYADGGRPSRPALRIQYKDYADWLREQLLTGQLDAQRAYWLQALSGELPVLALPADKTRPATATRNGHTLSAMISNELLAGLNALCQHRQCTLFMGLLAVLKTLFYRYSAQEDIIIGIPVAGRDHADLEDQIGFYINTLALRTRLNGTDSFSDVLGNIRKVTLAAYANQQYPFDRLVEDLELRRDMSHAPIFDIMLVLQSQQAGKSTANTTAAAAGRITDEGKCAVKFDLVVDFSEKENGLKMAVQFNTDIYEQGTIIRLLQHYTRLLSLVISGPDTQIRDYSYLSSSEEQQLQVFSQRSNAGYLVEKSIVDLFEEQVDHAPHNIALVFEGISLTYRQFEEQSNRLAHYLRALGVREDMLVAICTGRSLDMIIAIMAILKAGGAYVPIDPAYPLERIQYMMADSGASIVLTQSAYGTCFAGIPGLRMLLLDDAGPAINELPGTRGMLKVQQQGLAYVIYTSGSTGQPKGVMITHASVVSLLLGTKPPLYDFRDKDVWTMFHSYCFDFSVWEMFGALCHGGKLVIVPRHVALDTALFADLLSNEGVTVLNQTPNAFYALAEEVIQSAVPLAIRYVIFGGEALNPARLNKWYDAYKDCRLINMYGITETTVHVTYKEIGAEEIRNGRSNIGRAIPSLGCYILDSAMQPVPVGVQGELYISGAGLARGYLNREELTLQRFIQSPSERLYRTGDLGRWLPDGDIEYLGRIDDQVKIRGYRIETGEVEQALLTLPEVTAAVVLPRITANGQQSLVAYLVSNAAYSSTWFRRQLQDHLPDYMIPSLFVRLDRIPLTDNGKTDKKALPDPGASQNGERTYMAPRTDTEQALVKIYEELLHIRPISVRDNFFDLGVTSLLMVNIRMELKRKLHLQLDIRELYRLLTIEELAEAIDSLRWLEKGAIDDDLQKQEEFII